MFIGKVAKSTSEEELRAELEKYGSVESINVSYKGVQGENKVNCS